MSRFFTSRYEKLTPYTPGEQPQDKKYIKLNTNESPFPPSPDVYEAAKREAQRLNLYSDPQSLNLRKKMSEIYQISTDRIVMTNGSDEALNFAFMAFADETQPLVFPDITYGFYSVFAELNHIPYTEIPLRPDFTINTEDYLGKNRVVVIANPNAPTGIFLSLTEIERIIESDPDSVVIVDEAYIDFGGESAIRLTDKYDNLLVIGTFSKSRSLAGARLGFAIGNRELINDLETIRYSTNPYNVNLMTSACGVAALNSQKYYDDNCKIIIQNREYTRIELESCGFCVLPSFTNFLFAKSDKIQGEDLYLKLKEKGILVRHFSKEKISDYVRITIGTEEQMKCFLNAVKTILANKEKEK